MEPGPATTIDANDKDALDKDAIDTDAILAHVGNFGRYQAILMGLFSVINVLSAFHYFGQTFISIGPPTSHACDNNTLVLEASGNHSVVQDNNTCAEGNGTIYMYGYTSIAQQEGDNSWLAALGQSMFFVGSVVGSLALGALADRWGRLHVLVLAQLLALAGNVASALANNNVLFTGARLIAGLAADSNFVMMYILVMEYTRPSARTLALNLCIGVWYCIGCAVVPWLAVAAGTWRRLLLAVAAPHLAAPALYLLVPESAAWLLSRGRTDAAVCCYRRIAAVNHRHVPDRVYEGLQIYAKQHVETAGGSLIGLFKTPKLRRKTLILIFKSMVITLCYDAISRNINSVKYSPFVLFSITSLTIFPACVFILVLQDRIGRKAMASASLLVSGLLTLCIGFILAFFADSNPLVSVCLLTIARFGVTVAYNSAAQYAVELIPVAVRGQGVSLVHVVGYAASFFSPQLLYAARWWRPLPDISLGVLLLLGAASCLLLPETLGRALPVTLQDGEAFGEGEKVWEFPFTKRTESQQTLKIS